MTIDLDALYTDLHRHPELSFQETRTAGVITRHLDALGLEYEEGIGKTGIATVIRNGEGPVVWLRADTDGLPVEERTGLDYASTVRGVDPAGLDVPVMHACGHDMHISAMIGAIERLLHTHDEWQGTVVVVFQPAEEYGAGAQAMIADGVFDRFPRPDIVLGQHVTPLPAGTIGVRSGTQMAASDGLRVVLHGRGGHGSRPHSTIDPVVMAAATVMRLQTIVSREVDPRDVAVVTVGSIHAGLKNNIIPAEATLELSLRYPDEAARERIMQKVERVVNAEAAASGADTTPVITIDHSLPPTINDVDSTNRLRSAFQKAFGEAAVVDPGMFTGSEDVSWFAREAGVPLVYWFWGGADPDLYARAKASGTIERDVPTNHSPYFAPVMQPTLANGVENLVVAAREFLA
ncbi:amidohydrolase [Microbacterium sp. C7(2022)]|uniref:amidohydrolase n=1 Tax=Microbacterium sp. C7(2022) TaxID=2992759 RepID=UPI00237C48FC|nr:amidohydrolase [Microbacterium sp. C7(2022)]MDE0545072.1 amidohydrolase [Microbacterium sp. C7(2022)]